MSASESRPLVPPIEKDILATLGTPGWAYWLMLAVIAEKPKAAIPP